MLAEVEAFTLNEFIPALAKGGFIEADQRKALAARIARYSGLSETTVLQHNLAVPPSYFWKDLLRTRGQTVGRLDSRYLGIDRVDAGSSPDYNAELTSWLHSFTPAINHYLRETLKYKTDLKYNMFGPVSPWDNSDDQTGENLRLAMAQNPYLRLLVQSGYYDGATTYFDAKYTMWQLDPSGRMKDRMDFKGLSQRPHDVPALGRPGQFERTPAGVHQEGHAGPRPSSQVLRPRTRPGRGLWLPKAAAPYERSG